MGETERSLQPWMPEQAMSELENLHQDLVWALQFVRDLRGQVGSTAMRGEAKAKLKLFADASDKVIEDLAARVTTEERCAEDQRAGSVWDADRQVFKPKIISKLDNDAFVPLFLHYLELRAKAQELTGWAPPPEKLN